MTDTSPFPRQLKPVSFQVLGGDPEDRHHWCSLIFRFLSNQPCNVHHLSTVEFPDTIFIYPDANND